MRLKNIFAFLLMFCMTLSCMPSMAFAEGSFSVSYQYSGELPEDVMRTLPSDSSTYETGATVKAQSPSETAVTVDGVDYSFKGWDAEEKTVESEDLTFTGEWTTESEKSEQKPTEAVEQKEEEKPAVEEPPAVETPTEETEDISFTAKQADYLSYDPLYIGHYANSSYIDISNVEMSRFFAPVTAAKGIASYTIDKDSSLDENTFIAGMTYEMPVYNLDDNSKYYVTVPNVNKFNGNFKAFGLTVGYNNDEAETISGWKYEKGILYIPKTAIDKPKNDHDVPEYATIAVQLNYAIGSDMDFSKTIPVQVLDGEKPKNKTVHTENIFDLDTLTVNTGVKGRNAKNISVFLNGQLMPINSEAWEYDKSSGKLSIKAMPGVVSNVNVVFAKKTVGEKAKSVAAGALGLLVDEAYALSQDGMSTFKNQSGQEVRLKFDVSNMFVGWRGTYSTAIKYKPNGSASYFEALSGYSNSVKYLYGGYTSHTGSEFAGATAKEKDQWLAPLWAIQSYAVAADTRNGGGDQGVLSWNEQVTHYYLNSSSQGTMTMYEWLNTYRNTLEKSNDVHGGQEGNGIGGSNNFAFHFPANATVAGSQKPMAHPDGSPKANPNMTFSTSELTGAEWFAGGCSELGDAAESDGDGDVYITCLGLTGEYVVLAFTQVRSGQNMTGIYKFKVNVGYVQLTKKSVETETNFLQEAPNNYTLKGASYYLYTDAACTQRATDVSGNPVTLTTDANGKSAIVPVEADKTYYAKEVTASKGFMLDEDSHSVTVTVNNTINNPAPITSYEQPVGDTFKLHAFKYDQKGIYSWERLLNAEYTVKYYDIDSPYGNEPPNAQAASYGTPTRTWKFKTRKFVDPEDPKKTYAGFDYQVDEPMDGSDDFFIMNGKRVIPAGYYTIEETKAPVGLARSETVYHGRVYQNTNGVAASNYLETARGNDLEIILDMPEADQKVYLTVNKVDAETETVQGGDRDFVAGSLDGAEYEVYFDNDDLGMVELVGKIVTENGTATLTRRNAGREEARGRDLEPGIYYIKEVQASPGYCLDKYELDGTDTKEVQGPIEVLCEYDEEGQPVTKTITGSYEDGKHLFRTRAEVEDTLLFTYTVTSKETAHHTYISKQDITTGKELPGATLQVFDSAGNLVEQWVSTDKPHDIVALHDETQGLKDGKYILREITAPYGYDVAEDVEFEVKSDEIVNTVTMQNKPLKVGTVAKTMVDADENDHLTYQDGLRDFVHLEGLYVGRQYKVAGTLMDKESGEVVKDAEGHVVTGEYEFTATADTMDVIVDFSLDTSSFGKYTETVVYERLYRTGKVNDPESHPVRPVDYPIELQKHEDIEDAAQTVKWPRPSYNMYKVRNELAPETATDDGYGFVQNDKVSYTVVIENTGNVALTMDVSDSFNEPDNFTLPQVVRINGATLNSLSEDKNLANITIQPDTTAKVVFQSTVKKGVKEYLAPEAKDSDSLKDGVDCNRADKDNTPNDEDGYIDIAKTENVIYKYPKDIDEDWHHLDNKEDDAQTPVQKPHIKTTAMGKDTANHITILGQTVVTDVVRYSGLARGFEYTLKGELKDKATGETVATAEKTFTATGKTTDVEFNFTAEGNHTYVAFEELYDEGVLVAEHKDIEDLDQTVYVPEIGTKASRKNKKCIDTVTYKNLYVGGNYVVRGFLVNKKGKKLKGSDGYVKFTPTTPDGTVEMKLPIKYSFSKLSGMKLVAYEDIYIVNEDGTETIVASHRDVNDDNQTIKIPRSPKTGDNPIIFLYILLALGATAGLGGYAYAKRKK